MPLPENRREPIMKNSNQLAATILSLAILFGGCDKRSQTYVPPTAPSTAKGKTANTQPALTSRPTTQDLESGARKHLFLGALPLALDVPESWSMDNSGGSSAWLQGPSPHGEIRIQVTSQGTPFTTAALGLMDQQATKTAAESKGAIQVKPLRSIGSGAKAREQREVQMGTVITADGKPSQGQIMDWTVEVYVPQDQSYILDLLHFSMLGTKQYEEDKEFLEKIVSSLRYDAAKGLLR